MFDDDPRGHLARGLGRSYGDAALNSGGTVWEMTALTGIQLSDGTVTVGGGVALSDLLDEIVPAGYFVPVTPGTKFVTVGGAIAADVHGKNHHVDGTLGAHVTGLELLTADGVRDVGPGDPLFEATLGGMGLTGIITSATIRLLPIESAAVEVDTLRTPDLDSTLAEMVANDSGYRYSVAWVDLLARGRGRGRSVLTRGNHPSRPITSIEWSNNSLDLPVPDAIPSRMLNPVTMQLFNEAWYRKAPRSRSGELQTINRFFYPLDAVKDWNRLYGRTGFLQYQIAVPDASVDTIRQAVDLLADGRAGSFLVVLKRFGPGRGLLSFPIGGWTLTVDIPARHRGLSRLLDDVDRLVVDTGGRTYFAKDARTDPRDIPVMYPELDRWRAIVNEHDPDWVFRSDLERRLQLRGPR
jgi:decaprenylphospho-beta-D-ribofuranose 2-oxidase